VNEFKTYHPIVNFMYFVFVISFSCFLMHPVCLIISFVSAFTYSVMLKGKNSIKTNFIYMLPLLVIMFLVNPLFNHDGVTIISYLPSGNPITLESVLYGLCAALMIISVICHFSSYNEIMTSDKFIYLFGKVIPSMSLIISMTLRFVPRFMAQLKVVSNSQRLMGKDVKNGSIIRRAKNGLNILSIMTTWALENSIDTADSMKSRGYGLPKRTSFSVYRFDKRDKNALAVLMFLAIYILIGIINGQMYFVYFPIIKSANITAFGVSIFVAYIFLCMYPVIIEIMEVIRWKVIKLKM